MCLQVFVCFSFARACACVCIDPIISLNSISHQSYGSGEEEHRAAIPGVKWPVRERPICQSRWRVFYLPSKVAVFYGAIVLSLPTGLGLH